MFTSIEILIKIVIEQRNLKQCFKCMWTVVFFYHNMIKTSFKALHITKIQDQP